MEKADSEDGTKLVSVIDDFTLLQSLDGKDFEQLANDFNKLKMAFNTASKQRSVAKCVPEDRYATVIGQFYDENVEKIRRLEEMVRTINDYFKETLKKFGCKDDVKIKDMIATFALFFRQLREIQEEKRMKKEMEEELEKRKRANELMQQRLRDENERRKQADQEETNLVDNYERARKKQFETLTIKKKDDTMSRTPGGRMRTTLTPNEFGMDFNQTLRLGKQGQLQIRALQATKQRMSGNPSSLGNPGSPGSPSSPGSPVKAVNNPSNPGSLGSPRSPMSPTNPSTPGSPKRTNRVSITPDFNSMRRKSLRISMGGRPSMPYDLFTDPVAIETMEQISSDDEFAREVGLE